MAPEEKSGYLPEYEVKVAPSSRMNQYDKDLLAGAAALSEKGDVDTSRKLMERARIKSDEWKASAFYGQDEIVAGVTNILLSRSKFDIEADPTLKDVLVGAGDKIGKAIARQLSIKGFETIDNVQLNSIIDNCLTPELPASIIYNKGISNDRISRLIEDLERMVFIQPDLKKPLMKDLY